MPMRIFLSAGEPSGDLHGANLIQTLRQLDPGVDCVGFGGERMQAAGCRLLYPLTQLAVMWFLRVLACNPHPLWVVWAGPVIGVVLPVALWGLFLLVRWEGAYLLRFFAGFCLIANGAYISIGAFGRIGDAGEMRQLGSPLWLLFLFGTMTVPAGLRLWHRLRSHFGLGPAQGQVSARAAYWTLFGLVSILGLEFLCSGD